MKFELCLWQLACFALGVMWFFAKDNGAGSAWMAASVLIRVIGRSRP